jgi:hypothetical protein
MTVIVAFVGPDGAVMASDSESTGADETRSDVEKIWACGPLVLGYTGTTIIQQPLRLALEQAVTNVGAVSRWDVRAIICAASDPVLGTAYANHVPKLPAGVVPPTLAGMLLALGRDDDGYWILEVDERNGGTFYEDRDFHAVGSGSPAAQVARSLLVHYEPLGRSVPHLRLFAYRAVAVCIRTLGGRHGVGGRVRMWQSEGGGAFEQLTEADLAGVENGVEQWTTIEGESLDRVVLEEAPPEGDKMPDALEAEEEATEQEGGKEE